MKPTRKFCLIIIAVSIAILLLLQITSPKIFESSFLNDSLTTIISRAIGTFIFSVLIVFLEFNVTKQISVNRKTILFLLPCFIVAINNLPILSLMEKNAKISADFVEILFFFIECIFVASFEETAFRAVLLPIMLKNKRSSNKEIFTVTLLSSAIFGLIHVVNLFEGASPLSVLMQMGYSALIGGMCAVVFLKTNNIFASISVHAIYNFCGQIVTKLGSGFIWSPAQIILTAFVGIICAALIINSLLKISTAETDYIYSNKKTTS